MEITKVDESKKVLIGQEVKSRTSKKVCIYYPGMLCTLPNLRLRICRGCPQAAGLVRKNVIRLMYDYIKSFSISLMKSLNIQLSK
jgi:hypothetical protein